MAECNKDELVVRALVKKIVEDIEWIKGKIKEVGEGTQSSKYLYAELNRQQNCMTRAVMVWLEMKPSTEEEWEKA